MRNHSLLLSSVSDRIKLSDSNVQCLSFANEIVLGQFYFLPIRKKLLLAGSKNYISIASRFILLSADLIHTIETLVTLRLCRQPLPISKILNRNFHVILKNSLPKETDDLKCSLNIVSQTCLIFVPTLVVVFKSNGRYQ